MVVKPATAKIVPPAGNSGVAIVPHSDHAAEAAKL